MACVLDDRQALVHAAHLDVPPRRLAPPDRQHVVPLALREQRRGCEGHGRYLVFYLLCGLAAAAAQTFVNPISAVPMVGASGAISGVMGAYIVLYPRVRVHMLVFLGFFITRIAVPAYVMLGYWFLLQILGGLPTIADESGGVAFWAHAGGFIAGIILIQIFKDPELVAEAPGAGPDMEHGLVYRERY